jgi:hypothetical protein
MYSPGGSARAAEVKNMLKTTRKILIGFSFMRSFTVSMMAHGVLRA